MNALRVYSLISPWFRRTRMRRFAEAVALRPDNHILDIGGTPGFWQDVVPAPNVVLLNADENIESAAASVAMTAHRGDGCELTYPNLSFDIVFSNSTIEHVGTWERQIRFAAEARRVGRALWIQTPAREFFLEPHLLTPWVHWCSVPWQRRWLRRLAVRSWIDHWTQSDVENHLAEVRLITAGEMQTLFPDCSILREKFLGRTKSYIAVRKTPPSR